MIGSSWLGRARWGGAMLLLAAAFLAAPLVPSMARADAVVVVQVRDAQGRPAEGTVTLASGGRSFQCTTTSGSCTLSGVPGGMFSVTVTPRGGGASPPPTTAMIPPSGRVSLIVSTTPPRR